MNKLSKVSFFLFVTVYNYLFFRMIIFHYFYHHFGQMGILYTVLLAILVLSFLAAMPQKLMTKDYELAFQKSIFKYFYMMILLLESIFSISFCIYLLSRIFIDNGQYFVILTGIIFCILLLSRLSSKDIIEISTLFNMVGYLLLLISFLFIPTLDYSNLLPVNQMSARALIIFPMLVLSNNFSLLISKKDITFHKLHFMLAIFVALFCLGAEYLLLICTSGSQFFSGLSYVGFICFSIEPVSKYIGSFDFSYIIYILICCIFKYALNMSLIRHSVFISTKWLNIILTLLFISTGIICYYFLPIEQVAIPICAILIGVGFSILLWFIKECYFVRRTEE